MSWRRRLMRTENFEQATGKFYREDAKNAKKIPELLF
jgi:hypothetical protein